MRRRLAGLSAPTVRVEWGRTDLDVAALFVGDPGGGGVCWVNERHAWGGARWAVECWAARLAGQGARVGALSVEQLRAAMRLGGGR